MAAMMVCMTLPETFNQPTIENLSQDQEEEKYELNENTKGGTEEKALMFGREDEP